jgi:hypothetical protein
LLDLKDHQSLGGMIVEMAACRFSVSAECAVGAVGGTQAMLCDIGLLFQSSRGSLLQDNRPLLQFARHALGLIEHGALVVLFFVFRFSPISPDVHCNWNRMPLLANLFM